MDDRPCPSRRDSGAALEERVWRYAAPLPRERRLLRHHLIGSIAHARMLGYAGIIPTAEVRTLMRGLAELLERPPELGDPAQHEDLHGTVTAALTRTLGAELASKLERGRGRADQTLTDLRLWAREVILDAAETTTILRQALIEAAERQGEQLMPGYTDLQRRQPILLAHHLIAYVEMFYRDGARLRETYVRADILPLGAGDGGGVPDPVDRAHLAELLGMHTTTRNSVDAVGDRDFVVEHLATLAIIAMHMSRLAEDFILWSTAEFGFLELDGPPSAPSGGPPPSGLDLAAVVRGRTGQVYGALMATLTTMKGLPLSYHRDLHEERAAYFDAVDTVHEGLEMCVALVARARWRTDRLARAAADPLTAALVATLDVRGGTAPARVLPAVQESYARVDVLRTWIAEQRALLPTVERLLAD